MHVILLKTDRFRSASSCVFPSRYSPYGVASDREGRRSGYIGNCFESAFNLYLINSYRGYSPWAMRFVSPDGRSPFAEGGINAYAYSGGDPVNWVDRNGRHRIKSSGLSDQPSFLYDTYPNRFTVELGPSGVQRAVLDYREGGPSGPLMMTLDRPARRVDYQYEGAEGSFDFAEGRFEMRGRNMALALGTR